MLQSLRGLKYIIYTFYFHKTISSSLVDPGTGLTSTPPMISKALIVIAERQVVMRSK